jgi:hypothetical protein
MTKQLTEYFLYRWRYILGYAGIGFIIIALLFMAGAFVPGGLTHDEMRSVVTSSNINLSLKAFDPSIVINLPYHALQRISIDLLGVSNISIKLPSLILGAASAFGMLVLLRKWFRRNVAVITTILILTTGQFLFLAQSGSPSIIYAFWSVWLLVSATMVARQAKMSTFWKIGFFGAAALSLYTPLSIYILIAMFAAIALHPHLRFLVRRLPKPKLAIAGVAALIVTAPLIYAIIKQPSVAFILLGIPEGDPSLMANAVLLLRQYFDFISPTSSALMTPVYGLGSMALIVLGMFELFSTRHTARSYLIGAWILLLTPLLLLNPGFTSVTFLPLMLLMAMGVRVLIGNWYRLFPRNPYARFAGLIPLSVLIGGMVFTGVDRFTYGYLYDPNTASNFSRDLSLLNKTLGEKDRGEVQIIASDKEQSFYSAVASRSKDVSVTTQPTPSSATTIIMTRVQYALLPRPANATNRIITDAKTNDADRFYIYKTAAK